MTAKQLEASLRGLTLSTKPVSEATVMKCTALLLAGLHAQAKMIIEAQRSAGKGDYSGGELLPDRFIDFVVAYCLVDDDGNPGGKKGKLDMVRKLGP
jgi:hypothetical protein